LVVRRTCCEFWAASSLVLAFRRTRGRQQPCNDSDCLEQAGEGRGYYPSAGHNFKGDSTNDRAVTRGVCRCPLLKPSQARVSRYGPVLIPCCRLWPRKLPESFAGIEALLRYFRVGIIDDHCKRSNMFFVRIVNIPNMHDASRRATHVSCRAGTIGWATQNLFYLLKSHSNLDAINILFHDATRGRRYDHANRA
jgi:hypothetical protein